MVRICLSFIFILAFFTLHAQPRQINQTNLSYDIESQKCIICHDGSIGKLVLANAKIETNILNQLYSNADHSIGIKYDSVYMLKPSELINPASLPKSIRLVEGKVSCISCHEMSSIPNSSSGYAQVVYNECPLRNKSNYEAVQNLCLSCHIK